MAKIGNFTQETVMASHGAAISVGISYCKNYVKNLAVISLVA